MAKHKKSMMMVFRAKSFGSAGIIVYKFIVWHGGGAGGDSIRVLEIGRPKRLTVANVR